MISLMVMSLILGLILAMTSMVRVSTQEAIHKKAIAAAEKNALFAVQEAIGYLQKLTGPDQRVTATGENYSSDRERKNWTGVWDANPNSAQYTENIGWLNGNTLSSSKQLKQTVDFLRPTENQLSLKQNFHSLLNEMEESEGGFAWTVLDEGVKSKINPRYLEDYFKNEAQRPFIPGDFGGSKILGSAISQSDKFKISRLFDLAQLENGLNLEGIESNMEELFNHFTVSSLGVLSNVKEGGLKKNLSAAFSSDDAFEELLDFAGEGSAGDSVFAPLNPSNNPLDDPGGPQWSQMRSFYQSSALIQGDRVSMRVPSDSESGISPVLAQMRLFVYAGLVQKPADATRFDLYWFFIPSIALWNPYDVTLEIPDLYLRAFEPNRDPLSVNGMGQFFYGAEAIGKVPGNDSSFLGQEVNKPTFSESVKWVINNRIKSIDDLKAKPFKDGSYGAGDAILPHEPFKFKIPASSIAPGQAMVFGLRENKELRDNPDSNELMDVFANGNSYNNGFGFYRKTSSWIEWNLGDYDLWLVLGGQGDLYEMTWELNTNKDFANDTVVQRVKDTSIWGLVKNGYKLTSNFYEAPMFARVDATMPIPLWDAVAGKTVDTTRYPAFGYSFSYIFPNNSLDEFTGQKMIQWLAQHNPRAAYGGKSPMAVGKYQSIDWTTDRGIDQQATYYGTFTTDPSWSEVQINAFADGAALGTTDQTYGHPRAVLFTVPREEHAFASITDFTHTNFNKNYDYDNFPNYGTTRRLYNNYQPAYPIGNSFVDARIPNHLTRIQWADHPENVKKQDELTSHHYDYSYLLNEALFDRFFTSSLNFSDSQGSKELAFPLKNTRLISFGSEKKALSELRDFNKAAENLMVDGSLNINSMSHVAWESLFSAYLSVDSIETHEGRNSVSKEAPYSRLNLPLHGSSGNFDPDSNQEAFSGFRCLSSDEISKLSTIVVQEIKETKGGKFPFLSMSEFVNRDPSSNQENYRVRGLLQRSIDRAGLNDHFSGLGYDVDPNTEYLNDYPEGNWQGSVHAGVPGYLMQSDLLSKLDSRMSVRSDTFTIRASGIFRDPVNGEILAEKKCEVCVQRTPHLVDEARSSSERKYEIVRFKWLGL